MLLLFGLLAQRLKFLLLLFNLFCQARLFGSFHHLRTMFLAQPETTHEADDHNQQDTDNKQHRAEPARIILRQCGRLNLGEVATSHLHALRGTHTQQVETIADHLSYRFHQQ